MATALLLIDVQRDMLLTPSVAASLRALLSRARNAGAPVVHVRSDDQQLLFGSWRGEAVVDRTDENAFLGSALTEALPPGTRLVVAGVWSEHAVSATVTAALGRGYRVVLASGAHEGFKPEAARQTEDELAAAGAVIADADAVPFS
ncbi:isochorismatase family protein [Streptacidiphilus fuscans]|uniref:Isochorismatase family protein n=1 Tax=Streptacidiphilus fuscans TaxID=2789292 RepID=A0A931B6B0_9ACTN|nr:isochorismatase family protein [Streptacidiphilus fuscans]MBF9068633.1 isochorismatase family protein [Streptacidiphilus fuscans]